MSKSKYVAAPVGVRLGGPGTRRKNPKRFDAYVPIVSLVEGGDYPREAPQPVAATVVRIKINMVA
jgi:hypothetical protein